jgi:hypothetical protein
MPITSTPNDTTNESTISVFHDDDDEIQELSNVESETISLIDSQTNHIESSSIHHQHSISMDKTEPLDSSKLSLNHSLTQTLYAPKARRFDGTEIVVVSKSSLQPASSNVLLFNHCHFPRSLKSHGKTNTTSTIKRQLPSLPIVQSVEYKQFNCDQLYNLLDHLNNDSHNNFTKILDQLTLSTVIDNQGKNSSIENLSLINSENEQEEEEEEGENILPNIFSQSSTQEKLFYSKLIFNINDPKNIYLYKMTLSIVQLSASILLPYSILNGRRPLLKCSNQTNFKQIHSKQRKSTYQVTAIESSSNNEQLQQNDILLKVKEFFINLFSFS